MFETSPSQPLDEAEYDRRLERLVDSGRWSYDDARRILGKPPYDLWVMPGELKVEGSALARLALGRVASIDQMDGIL